MEALISLNRNIPTFTAKRDKDGQWDLPTMLESGNNLLIWLSGEAEPWLGMENRESLSDKRKSGEKLFHDLFAAWPQEAQPNVNFPEDLRLNCNRFLQICNELREEAAHAIKKELDQTHDKLRLQ